MESILNFLKKNWYWVAAAVLLIVIVVVVIRRKRKSDAVDDAEKMKSLFYGTGNIADPQGLTEAKYPLKPYAMVGEYSADKGSMGTQIRYLQSLINEADAYEKKLTEDGKYGPETLKAFKAVWGKMMSGNGTVTEAQ